jgi:hypothetical protein
MWQTVEALLKIHINEYEQHADNTQTMQHSVEQDVVISRIQFSFHVTGHIPLSSCSFLLPCLKYYNTIYNEHLLLRC